MSDALPAYQKVSRVELGFYWWMSTYRQFSLSWNFNLILIKTDEWYQFSISAGSYAGKLGAADGEAIMLPGKVSYQKFYAVIFYSKVW